MAHADRREIFDYVRQSVVVRAPDGTILAWNRASADLYGWPATDALGRHVDQLLHSHAEAAAEPIAQALDRSGAWEGQLRRRTASGVEIVVHARLAVRRDADGLPIEIFETGQDITRQLKAEHALKAAERRYTNLFQAMAASFWELDFNGVGAMLRHLRKQGIEDFPSHFKQHPHLVRDMMRATRIIDVNEETVRLFAGGDRARLEGSIEPYWPDASSGVFADSVAAAVSGAPSFSLETRLRRGDGTEFEALFTACFPAESVARGTLLIGVIDISERKRAQRELEAREQSYRYLFDYMPVSLWQIDSSALAPFYLEAQAAGVADLDLYLQERPQTHEAMMSALSCVGVNPRTISLFGGRDASDFLGPIAAFWRARPETLRRSMAARYSGALHHTEETRLVTLDGREIDVLYVIAWPGGASGGDSIAGLVDITERVRAQGAERQLREEFAHAARISMLGELTASIAHEVNQPLAAISTNGSASLRWLDRDPPDVERVMRLTQRIVDDARRAADIVLRVRKLAAKQPTSLQRLSVSALLDETAAFLKHELQANSIDLSFQVAADLPPILADRTQMQQVIANLLINASQAMAHQTPGNRRICVGARLGQGGVELEFRDTGPGLAADQAGDLFQSFFTTKASGLGMGLSICRSILDQHGGTIRAANHVEGGAMFTVSMPAADAAAPSAQGA